jgi:ectoine hydroxylase-related dioxygenase (phytanoyl-CoA dioxygenase family)
MSMAVVSGANITTYQHTKFNGRLGVDGPHTDEWMALATKPDILDIVERIIGSDIILWGTSIFYKRAENGPYTPYHRDGPFWPMNPIAATSVWISVFDSKADNSCLRCIPGSHRVREWGRHFHTNTPDVIAPITVDPAEYDESKAQDIELEPGQMVVFDVRTIHGARHNLGKRPRCGVTLRYMPSTSHYDHDATKQRRESDEVYERKDKDFDYAARPLFLVRGVDRCGLNDFTRNHMPTGFLGPRLDPKTAPAKRM